MAPHTSSQQDKSRPSYLRRVCHALVTVHSRVTVSSFALAGALGAILAATGLETDTSIDALMLRSDPDRALTADIKSEFSNEEIIIVAHDLGRPFQLDDLEHIRRLSDRLASLDSVDEVLDITTIEDVTGTEETLDAGPLLPAEMGAVELEALHGRVRGHRLYEHNLVSSDLDVVASLVVLEPDTPPKARTHAAVDRVREAVAEAGLPWPTHLGGYPVGEYEVDRIIRHDLAVLGPVSIVGVLVIVYAAARRLAALVLVCLLMGWSTLAALGWFALTATKITVLTSAVPAVLMACSAAYGIYALGLLGEVSARSRHATALVDLLLRPVAVSASSTCVGFLSLRRMDVPAINDLGTGLAVGIAAAAVGSLLLLPALVHRLDLRLPVLQTVSLRRWSIAGVLLAKRPALVLAAAFGIVLLAIPGLKRVHVKNDAITYFAPDNPMRRDAEFIRAELGIAEIVNVVFRLDEAGGALQPRAMEAVDRTLKMLDAMPSVDRTVSFLDYIHLMDAALRPGDEPRTVLPSAEMAAQYMLLYESGGDAADYRHYINFDRSALNAFVHLNDGSSGEVLALRDRVERFSQQLEGVKVKVAGSVYLVAKAMENIARSLAGGLITALWLIILVMTVALRSVKLALVAAVPNALPIIVCGAALGYAGIPLSIGTSVVGCIALGLAVDDTAHVLSHLQPGRTLTGVYRLVARPMLLTSLALAGGFSALMMSSYQPVWALGAATALTLGVAFLCDWLLLPSMVRVLGWPLAADIGEEPGSDAHPHPRTWRRRALAS